MYAASASKHKSIKGEEAKPADDWLVLPQIWVKGGEATLSLERDVCQRKLFQGQLIQSYGLHNRNDSG